MSVTTYRLPHRVSQTNEQREAIQSWIEAHDINPSLVPTQATVTVDTSAGTIALEIFKTNDDGTYVVDNRPGRHGYRKARIVRVLNADPDEAGLLPAEAQEVEPSPPAGPDAPTPPVQRPKSTKARAVVPDVEGQPIVNVVLTATSTHEPATDPSDQQS